MLVLVAQSCPARCDSMVSSPPGSSVHGIVQARILEWVPFPSPGDLPDLGVKPATLASPALAGGFFTIAPPGKQISSVQSLSCVRLFATPWTVAYQAPPSMGFSRQEYWSGFHFLLQGIFLTQG